MLRVVVLFFLSAVAVAQNCSETAEAIQLSPIIGNRPSSIHYAWLNNFSDVTAVAATIQDSESTSTLCAEGCSRLVVAESTWQPHFNRGDEKSGLELQSEAGLTTITAKRFGVAAFGCEPIQCEDDEVLVEAFVHVQGGGSVALQAADIVLEETQNLGYQQSCQPANECTEMCFTSTGATEPPYATGRIIVDGRIVFDKDLETFGCQDDSIIQVGVCSAAELSVPCDKSLLTVEVATDSNGPYSPYGVSWGMMMDGTKTILSPPNDSNGYESNIVFKEMYCVELSECAEFYIDNLYEDASFQVTLLLDGEVLEMESSSKGTELLELTECSSETAALKDDSLSGGAIAGIVIGLLVCCCCVLVAAIVNEQYS